MKHFDPKVNVRNNLSCSSCTHLSKEKLDTKPCKELGVLPTARPCSSFKADINTLRSSSGEAQVVNFFKYIRDLSQEQLPIIASLLIRESRTRKFTKFQFMQPVAVVIEGTGEYLQDYCRAYLLDADKDHVRVINKEATLIAQFSHGSTSLLTLDEFKRVKPGLRRRKAKVLAVNDLSEIANSQASKDGKKGKIKIKPKSKPMKANEGKAKPKIKITSSKAKTVAPREVLSRDDIPTIDQAYETGRIKKTNLNTTDLYTLLTQMSR